MKQGEAVFLQGKALIHGHQAKHSLKLVHEYYLISALRYITLAGLLR